MFQLVNNCPVFPRVINKIIYDYVKPSYIPQLQRVMNKQFEGYKKQYGGLFADSSFLEYFFTTSYLTEQNEKTTAAHGQYLHNYVKCGYESEDEEANDTYAHNFMTARNALECILAWRESDTQLHFLQEQPSDDDTEEEQQEKYNMKNNCYGCRDIHKYAN